MIKILFLVSFILKSSFCKPPHIILIMADDLVSENDYLG